MTRWPIVALGEVLTKSDDWIKLDPEREYKEVTVRNRGQGAVLRRIVTGAEIAGTRRMRVHHRQFIVSRIDARHGSSGVIPAELEGAIVTNDFPVFECDEGVLLSDYLGWHTKTPQFVDECRHASEGSTNRVRLKEAAFLEIMMPLPPVEEQLRVVRRIEQLAMMIDAARALRDAASETAETLCRNMIINDPRATPTLLSQLIQLRTPDVEVRTHESYRFAGVYCFGRGVFRGDTKTGLDFAYPRLTRLRAGDFVYPKLMAWEGAFGVVPEECDGCVVSTEFPVFEIDEAKVLHEVLDIYFRMPSVWPDVAGSSTGTNVRRRRLKPQDFLAYSLPLPSRRTQETLRRVRSHVDSLTRLHGQTSPELDALMASILDRAML